MIVIPDKDKKDSMLLIPQYDLGKFDKDGLGIYFYYRELKIHNPQGCEMGFPAEIMDISRK